MRMKLKPFIMLQMPDHRKRVIILKWPVSQNQTRLLVGAGPVPQIFITGHFLQTKRKTVYATPTASPALISLLLSSRAQGVLFVCTVLSFTSQHFNLCHIFSLQYIFNLALVAAFHSDREWREGFICQGYGRMRHPTFSRNEDGALCFKFIVQPSLQSGHMPRKRLPKLKSLDHCTF